MYSYVGLMYLCWIDRSVRIIIIIIKKIFINISKYIVEKPQLLNKDLETREKGSVRTLVTLH